MYGKDILYNIRYDDIVKENRDIDITFEELLCIYRTSRNIIGTTDYKRNHRSCINTLT